MLFVKKSPVDQLIERHITFLMETDEASQEYKDGMETLARLLEAQAKTCSKKELDPNVVLTAVLSLMGTLIILSAEEDGTIVTHRSAWASREKAAVRSRI